MNFRAILIFVSTFLFLTNFAHPGTDANVPYFSQDALPVTNGVDPGYSGITYSKSKFVPPAGKILLIGGQEKMNISEIPSSWNMTPGGFAGYIAISSSNAIWSDFSVENDSRNIQNMKWIADTYPNSVLQIAMWMVGYAKGWGNYSENTVGGVFDEYFDSFCLFAKTVKRPVFLRIGYEFDGAHNMIDPEEYVTAYRYIVDFIRGRGVSNVAFVWHSYAAPTYMNYPLTNWYPGDDYVDWFGVSVFYAHVAFGRYSRSLNAVVEMAREHGKPVMIAESCPSGGISRKGVETWNRWFVPYLNYIHRKNIKAFSYISCDWDKVEQFKKDHWGNTRVQDFPAVHSLWTNEMAKPEYLKASPDLFRLLGYTNN